MFDSFGYSIDSTHSGVQTAIRMFGQGLMCTAHAQYIHNCSSALAMSISMWTKRRTSAVWEFFELTEVVDDAEKKHKKAICKLCEGAILAYAGGMSNLFNHLEAKHPVAHTKVVPRECSTQKQSTLGTFATHLITATIFYIPYFFDQTLQVLLFHKQYSDDC